uniref:Uncharacterized protein n=1 Tax=Panagrolaimus davidi TaxID=227884 RepID=A0A914QB86_9BILA
MAKEMNAFDKYQQKLMKIIDAHPTNLINEIRPITIQFFTKITTSPPYLRQRALILILMVNALRKEPAYRSFVHAIFDEILFCVSAFLEGQDEEYIKTFATIEFSCRKMVEDTIPMIIQLRPKKNLSAIKALFKVYDESSDMAVIFQLELKKMIIHSPELVVDWIRCLKFDEFKKKYFEDLIVSLMAKRLDLKGLLIDDAAEARRAVGFLDKALDRKTYKGQQFVDIRSMFTDVEITKKITKIAKEYSINTLTFCPNSVKKRRFADFLYTIQQRGKQERAQLGVVSFV